MCQETCENRDDEQVSQDRVWYFLLVCGGGTGGSDQEERAGSAWDALLERENE